VADKIIRRYEQIAIFPQSGRRVPEYDDPNIREIIEPPYRLIYRIKIDQIDILAVIHGARRFPEKP
jgi:plasmid stabilization system protein ParE